MSKRDALRELQTRLAERMQTARNEVQRTSWLAVEAGGAGFLLPLDEAGEIFPVGDMRPLAHTQPWFCGVANLRGGLHGVVDLAVFLGLRTRPSSDPAHRASARLVALNPNLGALCALRVEQLSGLRHADQMVEEATPAGRPGFAGSLWRDGQGRQWQVIDLAALAAHEEFLAIAAAQSA